MKKYFVNSIKLILLKIFWRILFKDTFFVKSISDLLYFVELAVLAWFPISFSWNRLLCLRKLQLSAWFDKFFREITLKTALVCVKNEISSNQFRVEFFNTKVISRNFCDKIVHETVKFRESNVSSIEVDFTKFFFA